MQFRDKSGLFTQSLLSLQLQVETILDGAGGEDAVALLDSLSELSRSERQIALRIFDRVVRRLLETNKEARVLSAKDIDEKEFEESLYEELLHSLKAAANDSPTVSLELVPSKKREKKKARQLIDLQAEREARKQKELLN